jgi:purine-binding chemotaxis protein CheW
MEEKNRNLLDSHTLTPDSRIDMEEEVVDSMDYGEDEMEDSQKDKYLTFSIGEEDYGIEIRYVTEIVVLQEITQVPDMPDFIKGIINLRGNVIAVMDMRSRFNMADKEYDDRTCIIVVEVKDLQIGLIVDFVKEVMDIPENLIDPPPRSHAGIKSNYVAGMGKVGDKVKILLNVEQILYEEEMDALKGAVGK